MEKNKFKINGESAKIRGDEYSFENKGEIAEVKTVTDKRVRTLAELIEVCSIDLNQWKINRWKCNKWEMAYRSKERDNHTIVPLYQVWAELLPNKELIDLQLAKSLMMQELKKFSPKYPKIKYKKLDDECLLVIDMPDLHFGKLTWGEESGEDYDIHIAEKIAHKAINSILSQAKPYNINRILYPIGNDFFNVDNTENTTSNGTPQQEDTRLKKTYKKGRILQTTIIDNLSVIAPVDIIVIPGNHDKIRTFYLGDSLECWYHNNPNVKVDNGAKTHKYYSYGKTLLGYAHGYSEKIEKLPMMMPVEVPEKWANSKYREWHLGDKHHKKVIPPPIIDEKQGVLIRILRALTATDNWHFENGYIGSLRAAQGFIYHKEKGNIAEFTAIANQ